MVELGVRPHPWCAHTLVGPPRDHVRVVGSCLGLGSSYIGAWPKFSSLSGLLLIFLFAPFWNTRSALRFLLFAYFPLDSEMCPAKHVFSNTNGTRSIVYAYVLTMC